jgi:hypothetical protein
MRSLLMVLFFKTGEKGTFCHRVPSTQKLGPVEVTGQPDRFECAGLYQAARKLSTGIIRLFETESRRGLMHYKRFRRTCHVFSVIDAGISEKGRLGTETSWKGNSSRLKATVINTV